MAALFAVVLFGAGAVIALFALSRPINVGDVVNLGLMCDRICMLIAAGTLWIMGAVFMGASLVSGAIEAQRRRY